MHNIGEMVKEERKTLHKQEIIKRRRCGYKIFSIRMKDDTVANLDKLAEETNRSRNELINILLDYAIENSEVE